MSLENLETMLAIAPNTFPRIKCIMCKRVHKSRSYEKCFRKLMNQKKYKERGSVPVGNKSIDINSYFTGSIMYFTTQYSHINLILNALTEFPLTLNNRYRLLYSNELYDSLLKQAEELLTNIINNTVINILPNPKGAEAVMTFNTQEYRSYLYYSNDGGLFSPRVEKLTGQLSGTPIRTEGLTSFFSDTVTEIEFENKMYYKKGLLKITGLNTVTIEYEYNLTEGGNQ